MVIGYFLKYDYINILPLNEIFFDILNFDKSYDIFNTILSAIFLSIYLDIHPSLVLNDTKF